MSRLAFKIGMLNRNKRDYDEIKNGQNVLQLLQSYSLDLVKRSLGFEPNFDWQYIGQIIGGDFAKFCGLFRIYEL
jgi:hypothetical protein